MMLPLILLALSIIIFQLGLVLSFLFKMTEAAKRRESALTESLIEMGAHLHDLNENMQHFVEQTVGIVKDEDQVY